MNQRKILPRTNMVWRYKRPVTISHTVLESVRLAGSIFILIVFAVIALRYSLDSAQESQLVANLLLTSGGFCTGLFSVIKQILFCFFNDGTVPAGHYLWLAESRRQAKLSTIYMVLSIFALLFYLFALEAGDGFSVVMCVPTYMFLYWMQGSIRAFADSNTAYELWLKLRD